MNGQENYTSPLTKIKGILLAEYSISSSASYIDLIDDASFLYDSNNPDIRIIYNENLMNEFSFALNGCPQDKYDFVSVALRDLTKSLGFSNGYKINPKVPNQLLEPTGLLTDFENQTRIFLGNGTPNELYNAATDGSVDIPIGKNSIQLYAPNNWTNGLSLNYFIPDTTYMISNVLSYNFGRGSILRGLNDDYSDRIFKYLLGWKANYTIGSNISPSLYDGSTTNFIPYKGNFIQNNKTATFSSVISDSSSKSQILVEEDNYIRNYLDKFHPGISLGNWPTIYDRWTMSILKKDGTWDIVYEEISSSDIFNGDMNKFVFNYSDDEYARTCDGYLRGRLTQSKYRMSSPNDIYEYHSTYYVLDYLPQKIEIAIINDKLNTQNLQMNSILTETRSIRIGLKNLEGINRVTIEKKIKGNRLPTKISLVDFKKGYFDLEVRNSSEVTLTAIGYNDNGSSKSEPITISPLYILADEINISYKDNSLLIENYTTIENYEYRIYSIQDYSSKPYLAGKIISDRISLADIEKGLYALIIVYPDGQLYQYKFTI